MQKQYYLSIVILFLLLNSLTYSQTTIDGISGLEFNETDTSYSVQITDDFTLHGISVSPDALTLDWDPDAKQFEIYGSMKITIEDNEIEVSLGDSSSPGLVILNGDIQAVNMGITGSFNLYDISFVDDNVNISWESSDNSYEFTGSSKIVVASDTIGVSFGDSDNPGVTALNGSVTELDLNITTNFELFGSTFEPQSLSLLWLSESSEYGISGGAVFKVGSDELDVTLGSDSSPGILLKNSALVDMDLTVSGNFELSALDFQPNDLHVSYHSADAEYQIYGSATLTIEGNDTEVDLGDESSPGIKIVNNALSELSIGVTGDFSFKDISFKPQDLTFEYDKDNSKYIFYGTADITFESETITVGFGNSDDPGIEYSNKKITSINTSLTASFTLKSLSFSPTDLTFKYDESSSSYEIFGSCKVSVGSEDITVDLGSDDSPGIEIKSGKLEHIDFGLTADFKLKSLDFSPKDLTFIWDKSKDNFQMYGSATVTVESDDIEIDLGTSSEPGIVIDDGDLKSLNVSVSSDFELKALKVIVTDLTLDWTGGENYKIYGDIKLNIDSEDIEANMGTSDDPGLVVKSGKITDINIGVTGDLKIGGLEAKVKDLTVNYKSSSKKYYLSGSVSVDILAELDADLGTDGIEIDVGGSKDKLIVNDLTIEIQHANLGTIDLKDIKLKFDSNGIEDSDVNVSFPLGWEVEADITFTSSSPKKVNSIKIDWSTDNIDDAIEIPETGISIIYISGDIMNLTRPSDLSFTGTVGLVFAGPFSLDGKSAALTHMSESVSLSAKELILSSDVQIGAYKSGSSWKSLLGDGSITATLVWSNYYRFNLDVDIPTDPLVKVNGVFSIDSHKDLDGLLDVGFVVPSWIPFVGGDTFGSVDGALRYRNGDLNGSYGAAWVSYKTFGFFGSTHHVGARYVFGSRKVSEIGTGTIDDIESEIKDDLGKTSLAKGNAATYTKIIKTFDIGENSPELLMLNLDWGTIVDTADIVAIGPDGIYDLAEIVPVADTLVDKEFQLNINKNTNTVVNDSSKSFYLYSPELKDDQPNLRTTLTPGTYQLIFSYDKTKNTIDSLSMSVFTFYPEITGNVTASLSSTPGVYDVKLNYWTYLEDSVKVSFYWSDTTDYQRGNLIGSEFESVENDSGYITATIEAVPENIQSGENIYFYAVVDDGVNTPFYTQMTDAIAHEPLLYGKVFLNDSTGVTPFSSLHVYVDTLQNGSFDTKSTGGLEKATITDEDGAFVLNSGVSDSSLINVVIPYGYELDESSPNTLPYTYTTSSESTYVEFYIKKTGTN